MSITRMSGTVTQLDKDIIIAILRAREDINDADDISTYDYIRNSIGDNVIIDQDKDRLCTVLYSEIDEVKHVIFNGIRERV